MFVRFLFDFDLLFNLFMIALWPSVGKELFYFSAVLIVCVPFQFGVKGRMRNSIVSVPDHCLVIYICFILGLLAVASLLFILLLFNV